MTNIPDGKQANRDAVITTLIILGAIAVVIILVIAMHDIIQSGMNAEKSHRELLASLPCNWLKLEIDNGAGMWFQTGDYQYQKQVYDQRCSK